MTPKIFHILSEDIFLAHTVMWEEKKVYPQFIFAPKIPTRRVIHQEAFAFFTHWNKTLPKESIHIYSGPCYPVWLEQKLAGYLKEITPETLDITTYISSHHFSVTEKNQLIKRLQVWQTLEKPLPDPSTFSSGKALLTYLLEQVAIIV